MLKPQQIAAGRALLGWNRNRLAEASGVSLRTITRFETGESDITVSKLDLLEAALVAAGVEFFPGGVRCPALIGPRNRDRT